MSSAAVPKFNKGSNDLIYSSNISWNEEQQQKLENYVEAHASTLAPSELFTSIDWPYLLNYLKISNIEFLKLKVDEIFDDHYKMLDSNNNLDVTAIINKWKNRDDPILTEVSEMIKQLQLQHFEISVSERITINKSEQPELDQQDSYKDSETRSRNNNTSTKILSLSKTEMPKLTKTERRMSLDLMHITPNSNQPRTTGPAYGEKRSSLSKPAELSTTNVSVITKAEVKIYKTQTQVSDKSHIKNRFKDVSKKLKFGFGRKNKSNPYTSNPLDTSLNIREESDLQSNNKGTQNQIKLRASPDILSGDRRRKRASLVGENLPLYIIQQLDEQPLGPFQLSAKYPAPIEPSNKLPTPNIEAPIKRDKSSKLTPNSSVSKKQSRIQNLVANSQSLYAHSKDIASLKSGINNIPSHTSNTSGYETERVQENDSEDEEDDKEYISPNSLTNYYGMNGDENEEGEEILRGLGDDDVDFINVNESYDDLIGENEEDDEDYLFKI